MGIGYLGAVLMLMRLALHGQGQTDRETKGREIASACRQDVSHASAAQQRDYAVLRSWAERQCVRAEDIVQRAFSHDAMWLSGGHDLRPRGHPNFRSPSTKRVLVVKSVVGFRKINSEPQNKDTEISLSLTGIRFTSCLALLSAKPISTAVILINHGIRVLVHHLARLTSTRLNDTPTSEDLTLCRLQRRFLW
jgi:hypothetical protein